MVRQTPRVSVICVFHNAAGFLHEAIDSVLAQDFEDFELILVDDGSTDESGVIALAYADRDRGRIYAVQHPSRKNLGISASRNAGIRAAKGAFIAFIDADDRWGPCKLREQVALLERDANVDAICGSVKYWRSWDGGADEIVRTGDIINGVVRPPEASLKWYPLGQRHAPSMSDLLMRAGAVGAVGGFEDHFAGAYEDQAFLAKFYLRSAIHVSGAVWSDYRIHDASCMAAVTRSGGYDAVRERFFDWFDGYLRLAAPAHHSEVRAALGRARLRLRHPQIARPLRLASNVMRRLGMA